MEQKRLLWFLLCAGAVLIAWQVAVIKFFPPPKKPAQIAAKKAEEKQPVNPDGGEKPALPNKVADKPEPEKPGIEKSGAEKPGAEKEPTVSFKEHPHRADIEIGSLDPESGYRLHATLDSKGAVVSFVELNDKRYRELVKPYDPLRLIGSHPTPVRTFQTTIPQLDVEFQKVGAGLNSGNLDWEVVPGSQSPAGVTFRLASPDGKLEVQKRFGLTKVPAADPADEAAAYDLQFDITFKNRDEKPRVVDYELQGPTGVPLEGAEMGNKSRDVAAGFLEKGGKVKASSVVGKQVAATTTAGKPEIWQTPLRYIGVDVQYFTALVLPLGDQLETPYLNASKGVLVGPDLKEKSDVSVLLTSKDLDLPPAADDQPNSGALTHKYLLFVGPKRELLLRPIGAEKIINYGSGPFAFPSYVGIPQGMLALLGFFHNLFPDYAWPYGWAIIMLTVVVRSSLFPFSRKQAISAAKMQELQPEIAAIKKKYGSDHEKLGRAQMELYRKHNFNPLGGCLLMFVQLPIFIGLYQALNVSVDMRSAKFLWINNLAAPDALFRFPFALPFLGSEFNLLPIITMVLMLVQQKLFMPPAADEQAAMQQKMMTYMMVFMGFMFYWMPAGLCVYFIASSLWGLAERKLLPKKTPPGGAAAGGIVAAEGGSLPSAPAKTASMWTEGKKKSKRR